MNLEKYSQRRQFYSDEVPPLLSGCLESAQWSRLVDLGCGDGSLLYALAERGYLRGKTVYAVDLSQSRIDRVKEMNRDITCIVADACKTNIDDDSFDLLLSTQVIEHVADDGEMVREMHRILSPGGTVYLSTVFKKRPAWYFYRCNGKWVLDPTHLREYTDDAQLLDILQENGFNVLANKKTLDGRPIIDSILRRLHAPRSIYYNRFFKSLRAMRVPIPGYYQWELVCQKR